MGEEAWREPKQLGESQKNESQEAGGIIFGVEVMLSRVANSRTCGTAHLGTL